MTTNFPSRAAGHDGGAGAPPLVLIVDDFADNREMYAEYLKGYGFRVVQAADGQQALDQAFELRPDLIVMDLALPGLDGWAATRQLKNDERTAETPVIALTGHAFPSHSKSAAEAGCDAFLTKPCLPAKLLEEIRSLLAARGGKPAPPR